ncbi:Polynucleotide 5'-hydroxyl-kinase grc3 [Microbotryomycetes sp. JL221]|nr:Polynucleotide 5'-hydroxyl-kinase grc3 [Microbotryomycetes sp. JL221]
MDLTRQPAARAKRRRQSPPRPVTQQHQHRQQALSPTAAASHSTGQTDQCESGHVSAPSTKKALSAVQARKAALAKQQEQQQHHQQSIQQSKTSTRLVQLASSENAETSSAKLTPISSIDDDRSDSDGYSEVTSSREGTGGPNGASTSARGASSRSEPSELSRKRAARYFGEEVRSTGTLAIRPPVKSDVFSSDEHEPSGDGGASTNIPQLSTQSPLHRRRSKIPVWNGTSCGRGTRRGRRSITVNGATLTCTEHDPNTMLWARDGAVLSWPLFAPASHPLPPLAALPGPRRRGRLDLGHGQNLELEQYEAVIVIRDLITGVEGIELVMANSGFGAARGMWPSRLDLERNASLSGKTWQILMHPKPACTLARSFASWTRVAQQILNDWEQQADPPVVIIEGPKRVGKSSFARTLVNNLLTSYTSVAYLDTDLGQPEFTTPGFVSLTLVNQPLLGPPFTHATSPTASRFCGSTSPASDPRVYEAAVTALVARWHEVNSDSSGSTAVSPLVVNTHGWNKGLGADLVARLRNQLGQVHVVSFSPTSRDPDFDEGDDTARMTPTAFKLFAVDSIQVSPHEARWSASDLRVLSIVSYFHTNSSSSRTRSWDFACPLLARIPLLLPFAGQSSAISRICVPHTVVAPSQALSILNGSLIALAAEDEESLLSSRHGGSALQQPALECSSLACTTLDRVSLALVRAVDRDSNALHVYCPQLERSTQSRGKLAIFTSLLEAPLPLWLNMSLVESNSSQRLCDIEWANVPYLSVDDQEGAGRRRVRRNLMRRGLAGG